VSTAEANTTQTTGAIEPTRNSADRVAPDVGIGCAELPVSLLGSLRSASSRPNGNVGPTRVPVSRGTGRLSCAHSGLARLQIHTCMGSRRIGSHWRSSRLGEWEICYGVVAPLAYVGHIGGALAARHDGPSLPDRSCANYARDWTRSA